MIKLIIDSGADQNTWFAKNYDYGFLPLSIILENEQYLDKEEISLEELHTAMKDGKMPSTSQPSPGQVKEKLEEYRKNGDDVIIVSLWREISGTYQSIKSVIDEYKETHPEFNVALIDCKSGSIAETLLAVQVLEMIKANYTFEEIVKQAEWNSEHTSIYLTVDDLTWLVKGGRLSKAAGFVGSALKVKPIITVNEEELYSESVVRGKKRVYSKLVNKIKEDTADFTDQIYFISHVDEEENAKMIEAQLKEEIPGAKTMIFEFGAILAAHIGVGGVAISALNAKPETYILPE
jgi:DegV family protein with EDD domain